MGSITSDMITLPSGKTKKGLGGVLYPASVLCGLDKEVTLITNLAEELAPFVSRSIKNWSTLHLDGVLKVPGPGNRVNLFYPEKGERQEILDSVVPSLEPQRIINRLPDIDFLILLMISGLDITLENWDKIKEKAGCPIWMDIHSLALSPELGRLRKYVSLTLWPEWVQGVDYLQANRQEVASMLGYPEKDIHEKDLYSFGESVLKQGIKAVFITLGEQGILVCTSQGMKKMRPDDSDSVVDTTGCGDVFCGAAVSMLSEEKKVMEAVRFGLKLASRAAGNTGIQETFKMAQELKINRKRGFDEE